MHHGLPLTSKEPTNAFSRQPQTLPNHLDLLPMTKENHTKIFMHAQVINALTKTVQNVFFTRNCFDLPPQSLHI